MEYLAYEDIKVLRPKLSDDEYLEVLYHNYPSLWVEEFISNPLNPDELLQLRFYQNRIVNSHKRKKILRMGRQIGKSASLDTKVITGNGEVRTCGELYKEVEEGGVFDLVSTNMCTLKHDISKGIITDNGDKEIYQVKSSSGFEDETTFNHPYLVWRDDWELPDWVEHEDLQVGDRIAVTRDLSIINTTNELTKPEAAIIGYMIGDGSLVKSGYQFISADQENIDGLVAAIDEMGWECQLKQQKSRPYNYLINKRNQMKDFFIKHGQHGKTAHYKTIPTAIQTASLNVISEFIGTYWATDGWVHLSTSQRDEIACCSTSKELMLQMRMLLLRFGIITRMSFRKVKLNGKKFDAWTIAIHDKTNLIKFYDTFRIPLRYKQELLDKIPERYKSKPTNNNKDTIPIGIWNRVKRLQSEAGISDREMLGKSTYGNERLRAQYCPQRDKLNVQTQRLNDDTIQYVCNSDIYWDKVTSVKCLGIKKSYSITVPGNQTLVTGGFITHNTFLIVSLILYHGIRDKSARILVVGPQKVHIDNIFNELERIIAYSPYFQSEINSKTKQPRQIFFKSGAQAVGYTTGEASGGQGLNIRGTTANILFVDEADYINDDVMEKVVIPTTNAFEDPIVYLSSTPSGKKGFYRRTWDSGFYEVFHYKSSDCPSWTKQKEAEARATMTKLSYLHEYDAEWGDAEFGLFSKSDMKKIAEKSFITFKDETMPEGIVSRQYSYKDDRITLDELIKPKTRILGVDWNKSTNGTRLLWCDFDEYHNLYVRGKWKIDSVEFTQNVAMSKIIELHEALNFDYIMVDVGFGSVQIEDLHLYGLQHKGTKLDQVVKGVPTDSHMEIVDIATGEKRKTPVKNFIVESMVRYIEQQRARVPIEENISTEKAEVDINTLFDQLSNYVIDKYTATGRPVYKCHLKDHDVDALMFVLYGYLTEVIKTQNLWSKTKSPRPRTMNYDKILSLRNKEKGHDPDKYPGEEEMTAIGGEAAFKRLGSGTYKKCYIGNGFTSRRINREGGKKIWGRNSPRTSRRIPR